MCGIAGIFQLDGSALPTEAAEHVRLMTDSMACRGPDGEGLWAQGPICLGHRRLSIIDIAGGAQPMSYARGSYCTVFNGEIYNFLPLRQELAGLGHQFATHCDTEVLLAAYAQWGEACLEHFEGMFAFALWDETRHRLFCARDRFGKKPFFYTVQEGKFYFASELSALGVLGQLGVLHFRPSHAQIMRYLAYEYVPAPHTIYHEAWTIEPSYWLMANESGVECRRYWDMPVPEQSCREDEEELCARLRELLGEAVVRRMVSDVPLGVFLSGGIDSSIVTALMAMHSPTPVKTFSIGFREDSYDESHYARIVARAFGTDHHERILSAQDCAEMLPGIVSRMDVPMADASVAPTWLLSQLAREHVTVALGGDGADEFWAGYEHYLAFRLARLYNHIPGPLRNYLLEPIAHRLPASAGYINPRLAALTFLKGANAPDWLRVQSLLSAFSPEMQQEILAKQWLDSSPPGATFLDQRQLYRPTLRQYEHWERRANPLARAFHIYVRQFLLDDILVKVDRCSMLHSLEVRAPFLDRQVAEFAARLPLRLKLHGARRKYLLKKAFAQILPPEILHRGKRGFQIPVAQWLRGCLRPLMEDVLAEKRLREQGIFSPAPVRRLMDEHIEGKADWRKQLWTLLVFQLWWSANRKAFHC